MPGYRGHLVGGGVAYLCLLCIFHSYVVSPLIAFEWFLCALLGSLFPDIDTKSKGQKLFYQGFLIIFIVLLMQRRLLLMAGLSIASVFPLIVKHRGIFHSIWFLMGSMMLLLFYINKQFPVYAPLVFFDGIFFMAGIISHLWLDLGIKKLFRL